MPKSLLTPIREARLRAGLRQWQLAREVGVSESLFSKYENEKEPIPSHVLSATAQILKVEEESLRPKG